MRLCGLACICVGCGPSCMRVFCMLLSRPGKHAQAEAVGVLPRVALCGVLALSCVL